MAMNPELKAKWVEALRSGKYKQGQRMLRNSNDEYCCLGVLADVCGIEWINDPLRGKYDAGENGAGGYLPRAKELEFGLAGFQSMLSTMNDGRYKTTGDDGKLLEHAVHIDGLPFSKIADWIEQNL